jgi:hypothetical protein
MNYRVIGTRAKARDYVLAITAVANLVVAGFSPRSIHSHGHRPPLQSAAQNTSGHENVITAFMMPLGGRGFGGLCVAALKMISL